MHRIAKHHMSDFANQFEVSGDESKKFEAFVNYSIFQNFCFDSIDPDDLVYDGPDPGIDGFMTFVDGAYVSSVEEVDDCFSGSKQDVEAVFVFVQSKTSESWKKSEINNLQSAVIDFISEDPENDLSEFLQRGKEVFDRVILNVGKLRDGKPSASIHFVTTAAEAEAKEILAAGRILKTAVQGSGLFSGTDVELIGRDKVVKYWTASKSPVESALDLLGSTPFPPAPAIEQSLVVTVKARNFLDSVLSDETGRLRRRIFDENVRDFIGLDGDVNSEIAASIVDPEKQKRFGILNNGITIISPDVRIANSGRTLFMRDFQIVNGCQTSNVLYEHRSQVSEAASLVLKIVQTSDPAVVEDIVRSTNKQTNVAESQFLATLDVVKKIEQNFMARAGDTKYNLYFERRTNQFARDEDVKKIRVFDIRELARCVAAMFLDKPEIASRYPNKLTGELRNAVYDSAHNDEIYYAAAYSLYRIRVMLSSSKIDQRFEKLRWHIIMAIRYYVLGSAKLSLSSRTMAKSSSSILEFMQDTSESRVLEIAGLCNSLVEIETLTRDNVKTSVLTQDVRAKALQYRQQRRSRNRIGA